MRTLRVFIALVILLWLAQGVSRAVPQAPETPSPKPASPLKALDLSKEPIAFIGHGSIFDRSGKELVITPEFASEAESFYTDAVLKVADERTRVAYQQQRKRLLGSKNWDKRTDFFIKAILFEKLLKDVQPPNAGEVLGKHRLLKQEVLEGFEPSISVKQLLAREELRELR